MYPGHFVEVGPWSGEYTAVHLFIIHSTTIYKVVLCAIYYAWNQGFDSEQKQYGSSLPGTSVQCGTQTKQLNVHIHI